MTKLSDCSRFQQTVADSTHTARRDETRQFPLIGDANQATVIYLFIYYINRTRSTVKHKLELKMVKSHNSITLASSELAPNMFGASSELVRS